MNLSDVIGIVYFKLLNLQLIIKKTMLRKIFHVQLCHNSSVTEYYNVIGC